MPLPQVFWLKDNVPVAKRVTVSNCDSSSQLLIPSSERSDTGVYSITVKNLVGQETFSLEVRVTGKPWPAINRVSLVFDNTALKDATRWLHPVMPLVHRPYAA